MMGRITVRHWLVLLGLLCQGMACESWLLTGAFGGLWYAALRWRQGRRWIAEDLELVLLFCALVMGFHYSVVSSQIVWFASVSNALVIYQVLRLSYPLDARQKTYAIAVAITQVAVGAQVVYDYRFLLVLVAAVLLIPGALFELEAEKFPHRATFRPRDYLPGGVEVTGLSVLMVVFFLLFPRRYISPAAAQFGLGPGAQRPEIEMSDGGREGTDQILFRIEGQDITYLRALALDQTDGVFWTPSARALKHERYPYSRRREGTVWRKVKINAPAALQQALPTDGTVVHLRSDTVQRPYVAGYGGVMLGRRPRRKVTYEYWTRPGPLQQKLPAALQQHYLKVPELDPRVSEWLDQVVSASERPEIQARNLATHLRENFTYRIGAPSLSRETALASFLLEEREGHCERFAAALATLLRARGIPSRVVLGFLATEQNAFGGFFNVRAKHAHAWTEAWFPARGWVTLDATPSGAGIEVERRSLGLTLYEWVEYLWYAKIVEYGFSDQVLLAEGLGAAMRRVIALLRDHWGRLLVAVGAAIAVWVMGRRFSPRRRTAVGSAAVRRRSDRAARSFYGRMLEALARRRVVRRRSETPHEFLGALHSMAHPLAEEAGLVTGWFCRIHYGGELLPESARAEIHQALRRLRRCRWRPGQSRRPQ